MLNNKINNRLVAILVIFVTLLLSSSKVSAAKLKINADHQSLNLLDKTSYFRGNVSTKVDDLNIKADAIEISFANYEHQDFTKFVITGSPATINQDNGDLKIKASKIELDHSKEILILSDAVINIDGNLLIGKQVYYNLKSKLIESQGSNNDQVNITLEIK